MERPLLAFDIDGTLVPHGKDPDVRTIHALEKLRSCGYSMVVATARRRHSALLRLGEMAEFFIDGIFNTGASTWMGGRCVRAHQLEPDCLRKSLEILAAHRDLDFYSLALADERLAFSRELSDEELEEWGVERKDVFGFPEAVRRDPIRVCGWKAGSNLVSLAEELKKTASSMNWQVTDGGACLFGTGAGIGKGRALSDYAKDKGFSSHQVISFGDDHSDKDMLSWAGRSVAMESAPCEVKEASSDVAHAAEGGLAGWLENHLLKGV